MAVRQNAYENRTVTNSRQYSFTPETRVLFRVNTQQLTVSGPLIQTTTRQDSSLQSWLQYMGHFSECLVMLACFRIRCGFQGDIPTLLNSQYLQACINIQNNYVIDSHPSISSSTVGGMVHFMASSGLWLFNAAHASPLHFVSIARCRASSFQPNT